MALAAVDVAQPYVCVTAVASPLSRAAAGGGTAVAATVPGAGVYGRCRYCMYLSLPSLVLPSDDDVHHNFNDLRRNPL